MGKASGEDGHWVCPLQGQLGGLSQWKALARKIWSLEAWPSEGEATRRTAPAGHPWPCDAPPLPYAPPRGAPPRGTTPLP